jgi:nucleoid-associated protein YgaU
MAAAKKSKKIQAKTTSAKKVNNTKQVNTANKSTSAKSPSKKASQDVKISESYVSLILGAVVVIALFAFAFVIVKEARNPMPVPKPLNQSISPVLSRTPERKHTMEENESLWDVAVKYYGDGYKYVEIIKVNNLANPDYVPPGTVIIIPDLK